MLSEHRMCLVIHRTRTATARVLAPSGVAWTLSLLCFDMFMHHAVEGDLDGLDTAAHIMGPIRSRTAGLLSVSRAWIGMQDSVRLPSGRRFLCAQQHARLGPLQSLTVCFRFGCQS